MLGPTLDFDPTVLLLGFVFSAIGFVAFRYGRRMQMTPPTVLGFALMTYPIFVSGVVWTAVVGTCLTGGLWLWRE